jgi:4-amino-4-deoxy-L-arabinose transferase-like glycosyltransferase
MATQEYDPHTQAPLEISPALDGISKGSGSKGASRAWANPVSALQLFLQDLGRALTYLWQGRSLVGGLAAVYVAYVGQQALLATNDYQTSTRNYVLAAIILIVSFTHPSWVLLRNFLAAVSRPKAVAKSAFVAATANPPLISSQSEEAAILQADLAPTPEPIAMSMSAETVLATVPTRKARSHNAVALSHASPPTTVPAIPSTDVGAPTKAHPGGMRALLLAPAGLWRRWVALRARLGLWVTLPGIAGAGGLAWWSAQVLLQDYKLPLGGWVWAGSLALLLLTLLGAPVWPRDEISWPRWLRNFWTRRDPATSLGVPLLGGPLFVLLSGIVLALSSRFLGWIWGGALTAVVALLLFIFALPWAMRRLGTMLPTESSTIRAKTMVTVVQVLIALVGLLAIGLLAGWIVAAAVAFVIYAVAPGPRVAPGESLLPSPTSDFFGRGLPSIPVRWETLFAGGMMLLALYLRLNNLEYHPGIFGDEGEQGMNVRSIVEGRPWEGAPVTGETAPIFGSGWWQVPNLSFYVWSLSLRIFGDSMFGLRMFSAISGLLAVWYIYRIGRLLWGPRAGLIAGTMLAVSPLALQFSKFANVSSATSALWAVGFFYFFMALRYRKWSDWILAGFFWSLNLYFYPAGKLIIPLVGVAGLYCLVRWRWEFIRRYALGFALLGVVGALTFMPFYTFSVNEKPKPWYSFSGRADETSIFSPQNQAGTFGRYNLPYNPVWANRSTVENIRADPMPWAQLVYQQSRETMDSLFRRGDQVFYYRLAEMNRPVFSPLWAVLALLGLAYAAWKAWDARFALTLMWFGIGLSASILTVDTPNLQRFTGAWPVVMLFPAVLVDRMFAGNWKLSTRLARRWATLPVAALLVFLTVISYREYFLEYPTTCPYCRDTVQARFAQSLGQEYKGYQMGVGNGYDVYFNYGSTRFAAKGVEGREMLTPADTLPVIDSNGKGAAFIVYPNNYEYLPMLRVMYPQGVEEQQKSQDGVVQFTSYKVSREQLAQSQTFHATYGRLDRQGVPFTRDEPSIGNVQPPTRGKSAGVLPMPPVVFPAVGTWQGGLVAPTYGAYTLALDGAASNVTLVLDGRTVLTLPALDPTTPPEGRQIEMVMAKGLHDVRLSGTLQETGSQLQLLWASGGPLLPIESTFLYNGPTGGLLGEIVPSTGQEVLQAEDPLGATPRQARRSDSFVGFREASVLLGGSPYVAQWQGILSVPTAGDYGFSVNTGSTGFGMVRIDGHTAFGNGPDGPGTGTVNLAPGDHQLDVRYASVGGLSRVEFMWAPPGEQTSLVPPTVLTPLARSWPRSELPDAPVVQIPQVVAPTEIRQPELVISEGLSKPKGIAVDKDGNIYVGDRGNHRVVVYSPDGKKLREWGKAAPEPAAGGQTQPAHQPGEFADISDLAVTQDGTVYVFDSEPRVQAFKTTGEYIGSYEPEQLGLYGPNGISEDAPSTSGAGLHQGLYIGVTGQNRVLKLPAVEDVGGGKVRLEDKMESAAGTESGRLDQPIDAVMDPSGTGFLYEVDINANNTRIARLKPVGAGASPSRQWEIVGQWRVQIGHNDGGSRLAITKDGKQIYMSDPDRHRVTMLNVETGEIAYFGQEGSGPGTFAVLTGIAVGPDGKIYVVDAANNNIQVFSPVKVGK